MSLPAKEILKNLKYESIATMRSSIINKSPLFIFAQMSVPGFFISNEYMVKDKKFTQDEEDILLTIWEVLRFEFSGKLFDNLVDETTARKDHTIFSKFKTNKLLQVAYLLALHKDLIVLEAEEVATEHLKKINNLTLNTN